MMTDLCFNDSISTKPRLQLEMMGIVYQHLIDAVETGAGETHMGRHTTLSGGEGVWGVGLLLLFLDFAETQCHVEDNELIEE